MTRTTQAIAVAAFAFATIVGGAAIHIPTVVGTAYAGDSRDHGKSGDKGRHDTKADRGDSNKDSTDRGDRADNSNDSGDR
jgi:hypothetical protein